MYKVFVGLYSVGGIFKYRWLKLLMQIQGFKKEMFLSNIKLLASTSVRPINSLSALKSRWSGLKENSRLVTPLENVAFTPGSGLNGE